MTTHITPRIGQRIRKLLRLVRTLSICRFGVWFPYQGDEVCYIWPWKRNQSQKFVSLIFEGDFNSLKQLREMWDAYELNGRLVVPPIYYQTGSGKRGGNTINFRR